jgi:hypothetical protein
MFLSRYVDAKNNLGAPASFGGATVATKNQCEYNDSAAAALVDRNLCRLFPLSIDAS